MKEATLQTDQIGTPPTLMDLFITPEGFIDF